MKNKIITNKANVQMKKKKEEKKINSREIIWFHGNGETNKIQIESVPSEVRWRGRRKMYALAVLI